MLTIVQVGAHVDVLSHARLELQLVSQCVILVEIELSEVGQVFVKDVRVVRRPCHTCFEVVSIDEPETVIFLNKAGF